MRVSLDPDCGRRLHKFCSFYRSAIIVRANMQLLRSDQLFLRCCIAIIAACILVLAILAWDLFACIISMTFFVSSLFVRSDRVLVVISLLCLASLLVYGTISSASQTDAKHVAVKAIEGAAIILVLVVAS